MHLPKTIVLPPPPGKVRKLFRCPACEGRHLKRISATEIMLEGGYPAPQVEVRFCTSCGTYSERDRWVEDRMFWKAIL